MKGRMVGFIEVALVLTALVVGTGGVALAGGAYGSGSGGVGPGAIMSVPGQGGSGPGPMTGGSSGRGGMMGSGPGYGSGGMMRGLSLMAQMMGFYQSTGPMSVTTDQAKQIAQQWLDQNQPGSTTETPDQFFGYYTVHTLKDGKVTGMLSVNGYTGEVRYHLWHGTFIQVKDLGA